MHINKKFAVLASSEEINAAGEALVKNGFRVIKTEGRDSAKKAVLALIPKSSEVFTMTSVTLDVTGISKAINESGDYISVRNMLNTMDKETQNREMARQGAAPLWAIGSVHALTLDGKAMIASNTGSQLPAYSYGAEKIIWVVGAQKIVKDMDTGFKRIYEYSLPLESERAKEAYGVDGSAVNKVLIVNTEVARDRITVVIVNERLGF